MQDCLSELTEDMPLRKEEKEWIEDEIRTALRTHLDPRGWKRLQTFLPLAAVIGIFIALLALAGGGWNYAFSRVESQTKFQTQTTDSLKTITDRLTRVEAAVSVQQAQLVTQKYVNVQPKDLKPHTDELKQVKASLAGTDHNAPGFWPASFQVITLLSQAGAASLIDKLGKQRLSIMDNVRAPSLAPLLGMLIDSQNVLLKNEISGMEFRNSIIHFDPSARLSNVTFNGCILIFPLEANPPKNLQAIGTALLKADIEHATISGL
jgi:hypothetical protein